MPDTTTPTGAPRVNGHDPAPTRAAVNRANSEKSTGPRTEAGKKRSAMNALRHGLTGHTVVLPAEDLAAYQRHVQSFADEYQPKGPTENFLVQDLADTAWRLNRIPALETNLLSLGITEHTGAIHCDHPQAQDALASAAAFREQAHAFAALGMHGQRLSRQFHKTLNELRATQAARRRQEKTDLRDAADLVEMHQSEDLPYEPAKDGFVFSGDEIQAFIGRRDRDERAYQARNHMLGVPA